MRNVIGNLMRAALSLLSVIIILTCCNNDKQPADLLVDYDTTIPDTAKPIITTSFKGTTFPSIFEAAFEIGTKVSEGDWTYKLYNYDIGKIKIESGKIIACDPIVMHDAIPFTQTFPIGEFPVNLSIAINGKDERVAFSRIAFSNESVSKWEFALPRGQKPISLYDSTVYCYGVDAGMGVFIDSVSSYYFNLKDQSDWENVFIRKAEKKGNRGFINDFDGHNFAIFSTGYGDGCYATFVGFDAKGQICQILTDFGLVGWWKLKGS